MCLRFMPAPESCVKKIKLSFFVLNVLLFCPVFFLHLVSFTHTLIPLFYIQTNLLIFAVEFECCWPNEWQRVRYTTLTLMHSSLRAESVAEMAVMNHRPAVINGVLKEILDRFHFQSLSSAGAS